MGYVIRGQLDFIMYIVTELFTFYRDILGQDISREFEPLIGDGHAATGFLESILGINKDATWVALTSNCDPETCYKYYEYDDPSRKSIIYPL